MTIANITLVEAVTVLNSLALESKYSAESGDVILAKIGRANLILSTILLKMLSSAPEEVFNSAPIASFPEAPAIEQE